MKPSVLFEIRQCSLTDGHFQRISHKNHKVPMDTESRHISRSLEKCIHKPVKLIWVFAGNLFNWECISDDFMKTCCTDYGKHLPLKVESLEKCDLLFTSSTWKSVQVDRKRRQTDSHVSEKAKENVFYLTIIISSFQFNSQCKSQDLGEPVAHLQ